MKVGINLLLEFRRIWNFQMNEIKIKMDISFKEILLSTHLRTILGTIGKHIHEICDVNFQHV